MSRRRRPAALLCGLIAVSLVSSACGLKPAQKDALKQGGAVSAAQGGTTGGAAAQDPSLGGTTGGATSGTTGAVAAGTSGTTGSTVSGTTGSSTTGGTTAGTTGVSTTGGAATGTTGGARRGPCSAPSGGDSTGITSSAITIGIHAPQTGTGAPLPPSFQAGAAVYWKTHKICGRTVNVDFQDDKYTPQTARQVCEPMSRRDFFVIGAAGTDQIQSCATDPAIAGKGVPYLSAGVTTNGLTGLNHYFATTLTYSQQGPLVVRNAELRGFAKPAAARDGKQWAVVTSRTKNFDDATAGIENALKAKGISCTTYRVDPSDDGLQQRAAQTGTTLATQGYGTVFVDTSPGYFIYMSQTASKQGFNGQYTGPGVTMTEVTVAQLVCGANPTIKANFLAPYPGIDRATDDFKKATGGQYDDIYWSLWGLSQAIEQALNNASDNLTRQNFIAKMTSAQLPGGVYPPIKFGGDSFGQHFGGTGAFSQTINCTQTEPNQSQPGAWDTVGGLITK
jgi:hypothetical protein